MKIASSTLQALHFCLDTGLPFAALCEPQADTLAIHAAWPDDTDTHSCTAQLSNPMWEGVAINFFGNDEPYTAGVAFELDENQILQLSSQGIDKDLQARLRKPDIAPQPYSTNKVKYLASLPRIIRTLKSEGGKVVISQVTALTSTRDIADVFADYASEFPHTLRFMVYTPETGLWLGATPELLADFDLTAGALHTMALAGTRRTGTDTPWDEKNKKEQSMVTAFICEVLADFGFKIKKEDTETLTFGEIEHLCTRIDATAGKRHTAEPEEILQMLSPTPALSGLPRDKAALHIHLAEQHDRLCYGGYIAIKRAGRISAYVNLRSALAAPCLLPTAEKGYLYNVFTGGGITAKSIPADEWNEAMAKASRLITAIAPLHQRQDHVECKLNYHYVV